MSMVCGLDLHRQQITFDAVETESGEVWRGRVWQPDRERFRRWLRHDVAQRAGGQPVAVAVEGCTGWRYVVEEIVAAGFEAHLAEPADTQAARGRKRHAKTDRTDARLLRELLQSGDLPESWIPPTDVLEWRERVRLYKSLVDQRTSVDPADPRRAVPARRRRAGGGDPLDDNSRPVAQRRRGSDSGRPATGAVGYVMIDATDVEAQPLKRRAATLRPSPAGVPGVGRRDLRHRRVDRGGGVVRARRLSTLLPVRAGGAPQRPGRHRRRLRPSSRPWPSHPPGSADVALGVVRSGDERVASPQPRPRLLQPGEGPSRRQAGRHLGGPLASSPDAATTCCAISIPTSSTRCRPDRHRRSRRPGTPTSTSRVSTAVSSCHRRARQPPCWTAF